VDNNSPKILAGVISDTHGLLRPEAEEALSGVDLIIHAGDVGSPAVLARLEQIAPVKAVRGNMDYGSPMEALPSESVVDLGCFQALVLHDLGRLDLDPAAAGFNAVISWHTHRPRVEHRSGVLYLNPGSAGHRRNELRPSLALLRVAGGSLQSEIVEL